MVPSRREFGQRAGMQMGAAGGRADGSNLNDRIHAVVYKLVQQAVKPIVHLEKTWSEEEIVKRLVRYLSKNAKPEQLLNVPWEQAAEQLIENSMHACQAACGDKKWFFEVDLSPIFAAVITEIARSHRQAVPDGQIQRRVSELFEEKVDDMFLLKTLWDVIEPIFEDAGVRSKVYNALSKTYQVALDATLIDRMHLPELQRVEAFVSLWMEESMGRAWASIAGSEQILTEKGIISLFQNLIRPFGDDVRFSCIPGVLMTEIGPPPRNWHFVLQATKELLRQWQTGGSRGSRPAKRRKVTHEVSLHQRYDEEDQEEEEGPQVGRQEGTEEDQEEEEEEVHAEGHPECTCAEDCLGSTSDTLVRHILEGVEGDLYCSACWEFFCEQDPSVEAVLV